jgi:hypothetical protein
MDMRRAVIVALDVHVTVGMQLRVLPLPAVELHLRQRLERGFLDRLEALAARDAEAGVARSLMRSTHSIERWLILRERGEARAR